jgi:hypothetical protein
LGQGEHQPLSGIRSLGDYRRAKPIAASQCNGVGKGAEASAAIHKQVKKRSNIARRLLAGSWDLEAYVIHATSVAYLGGIGVPRQFSSEASP